MMKMLTASASVWYGRISPHVELISPSRSWISQIEMSPVTRLGTKSEPTRIASTIALPGVGRCTSAYPANTATVDVMTIVANVSTMLFWMFCGSVSIAVSAVR